MITAGRPFYNRTATAGQRTTDRRRTQNAAGIIMAGYMDALNESKQMKDIKDQRANEEFIREAQKLSDEDQAQLAEYIKYLKFRSIG